MFHICPCYAVLSVPCSLISTNWERADLLAFLPEVFSCVFVTFLYFVSGQVWHLIVTIPESLPPSSFIVSMSVLLFSFAAPFVWVSSEYSYFVMCFVSFRFFQLSTPTNSNCNSIIYANFLFSVHTCNLLHDLNILKHLAQFPTSRFLIRKSKMITLWQNCSQKYLKGSPVSYFQAAFYANSLQDV